MDSEKPLSPFISHKIEIRETPDKGWGVFAKEPLAAGEIVEISPLIKIRKPPCKIPFLTRVYHSMLFMVEDYLYWMGNAVKGVCLGYGQLYNHATHPNVDFRREGVFMVFTTNQPISAGSELTNFYKYRLFKENP